MLSNAYMWLMIAKIQGLSLLLAWLCQVTLELLSRNKSYPQKRMWWISYKALRTAHNCFKSGKWSSNRLWSWHRNKIFLMDIESRIMVRIPLFFFLLWNYLVDLHSSDKVSFLLILEWNVIISTVRLTGVVINLHGTLKEKFGKKISP